MRKYLLDGSRLRLAQYLADMWARCHHAGNLLRPWQEFGEDGDRGIAELQEAAAEQVIAQGGDASISHDPPEEDHSQQ
jgi:hypothetical protein